MDLVIELDNAGRIWLYAPDGTVLEEAWVPGANDNAPALRQSGLCPIEEKYPSGHWTSTTLDTQEIVGQLWVEDPKNTQP